MTTIQTQEWKNGAFGCFSPFSTCCLACWCPCMLYGRTRHRFKNNGDMSNYTTFNPSCGAFCGLVCLGIPFVLPWISRGDIRGKYHLAGSGLTDFLCSCCCSLCDLVQQEKEVIYRESAPSADAQPARQEKMNYAPQQQLQQQHQQLDYSQQYVQPDLIQQVHPQAQQQLNYTQHQSESTSSAQQQPIDFTPVKQ